MPPRLRSLLADLPGYRPGRRPAAGQELARLASNETPYPPLPSVVEAVVRALAEGNRYPDPAAVRLTAALADRHGVDVAQVAVGCGSVALVQELVQIACDEGDEVLYGWRSFEAYPTFVAVAGAREVAVPLRDDAALDLDAMAAAVTSSTRLVLLCSPNNPTGPALSAAGVQAFLGRVPADVLVVLDEAYIEFVDDPEAVDGTRLLSTYPNLVVLRTFSKAYGLAGLRVGYALGAPEVIGALRQVHVPFAVSLPAQAAALASLTAEPELLARVDQVVAEREPLRQALRELGHDVPVSQGNFLWLPAGERSERLSATLEENGVLVRCFAGEGLRVTVTTAEDSARVLAAVRP